ncbi:MAG TPA: hypothetical protein ENK27_14235 [Desulfobulbus sp.]|nr:hypothetical protein [Desulfobulbus sp.]
MMNGFSVDIFMDRGVRRSTIILAVLLMITGMVGILLPQLLTLVLSAFIGFLLLAAGILAGYLTWLSYSRNGLAWLKPFLLVVLGLLLIFRPIAGAATLGLLLIVYFLLDGFFSITFSLALRPLRGWGWTMFNGILSILLAVIFLVGWPFTAAWLVGLLVGISLIMDGVALLMLALSAEVP